MIRSFSYYGGKQRHLPFILRALPPPGRDAVHFVDAFGGSGVLTANVRYRERTYNDRNGDLVTFFRVLRDRPAALLAALELTPYSRAEYRLSKESLDDLPEVERARRIAVRIVQSFNNMAASGPGWSVSRRADNQRMRGTRWARLPTDLAEVADALRGVHIEQCDALALLVDRDHPGNVLYLDPPYLPSTRLSSTDYGEYEMSAGDHERMVAALREVKNAKVALSSYPNALYDSLGWRRVDCETIARAAWSPRTEAVYLNYDPPSPTLIGGER